MIEIEHRVTLTAKCPKDGSDDHYNTLITVNRVLPVEDILAAAESLAQEPIFQEDLTRQLAFGLAAEVTTHGIHSGVYTTCRYDGRLDA